jgi:hypothetical protein
VKVLVLVGVLLTLACKDPFDYGYNDPDYPDPPGPPVTLYPREGQQLSYAYPDTIELTWSAVQGAESYDLHLSLDSSMTRFYVDARSHPDSTYTFIARAFGWHYWRVRAKSRFWNRGYTEWCPVATFLKPRP